MKTDTREWTVIQRPKDRTEKFCRDPIAYRTGFGKFYGKFLLCLENIHRLTNVGLSTSLRVEGSGKSGNANSIFRVSGESDKYRFEPGGYSGNAGDSLTSSNGMFFTTYDKDNDKNGPGNCANVHGGIEDIIVLM